MYITVWGKWTACMCFHSLIITAQKQVNLSLIYLFFSSLLQPITHLSSFLLLLLLSLLHGVDTVRRFKTIFCQHSIICQPFIIVLIHFCSNHPQRMIYSLLAGWVAGHACRSGTVISIRALLVCKLVRVHDVHFICTYASLRLVVYIYRYISGGTKVLI